MAKQKPIHERVQAHVDDAGLSNADLAKKTGWHELRVWRLLTGRTEISAEDMEVFAKVLGKPVADLYKAVDRHAS